jgi:hypothetical protein
MPAAVAAAAGESLLAAEVAAPLFAADAAFIPAAGALSTLPAMEGMGALGGLGGLGGLLGGGVQFAGTGLGAGGIQGGLGSIAPEAFGQVQAALADAVPGANQAVNEAVQKAIQNQPSPLDRANGIQGVLPQGTADLVGGGVQPTFSESVGNLVDAAKNKLSGIGDMFGSAKKWVEDNPKTAAAAAGLGGYMLGQKAAPGLEEAKPYSGPLSKFHYDPAYYKPSIAQPPTDYYQPSYKSYRNYADGGNVQVGGNPGMALQGNNDPLAFQSTGVERMASGGISDLGAYSDGGRMLKGPGDGMSDDIPATIADKQPARLANEEFVIPADVVSHLGNGSSDAGAKQLYKMMDRVRQARTGNKKQGKQINPNKYVPA